MCLIVCRNKHNLHFQVISTVLRNSVALKVHFTGEGEPAPYSLGLIFLKSMTHLFAWPGKEGVHSVLAIPKREKYTLLSLLVNPMQIHVIP